MYYACMLRLSLFIFSLSTKFLVFFLFLKMHRCRNAPFFCRVENLQSHNRGRSEYKPNLPMNKLSISSVSLCFFFARVLAAVWYSGSKIDFDAPETANFSIFCKMYFDLNDDRWPTRSISWIAIETRVLKIWFESSIPVKAKLNTASPDFLPRKLNPIVIINLFYIVS